MSLLVGTVFADHPRSRAWYELQLRYLSRTTIGYTHAVYLNGKDNFYSRSLLLKADTTPVPVEYSGQHAHIRGLNYIIDHFNGNPEYDCLLLLDSDCFPVAGGWQRQLSTSMRPHGVAAVARYENLDTFAHPCVFYVTREEAQRLRFGVFPQTNICGHEFADTSSNVNAFYPLIRTNRLNHHPVLCGLYWNTFYHHGAGSRNLTFRLFYSYFNETNNVSQMESKLFAELMAEPDSFLSKLGAPTIARKMY